MDQKIWDTNVKSIEEWFKAHPDWAEGPDFAALSAIPILIEGGNAKSVIRAAISRALWHCFKDIEGMPEIISESGHPYPPIQPCEICGGTGKGVDPCNVCSGYGMVENGRPYNPDDPDDVEYFSHRAQSCNNCDDGTSFCDDCGGLGHD